MEHKRLYRSSSNSVIAGVCGGLGEYLNTDPVLFRILFALAVLFGGGGLIVYIVLWIVIPYNPVTSNKSNLNEDTMNNENLTDETKSVNNDEQKTRQRNDGNLWGGLILITLGAIFLVDRFVPRIDFGDLWPVILIIVGIILITKTYQQPKQ